MSQEQYNFLDELGLGKVIGNVKSMFAKLSHSHKLSDISDYTVDSTMSSTSTNPVQNKVINSALSGKVPTSRTINGKKLSSNISLSASDVGAATANDVSTAKNEVQTNLDTHIDNADIHFSATERTKLDGIASGANKYTHPTSSGNKHIPSGGSSGQILRWSADGTAVWGNDNNTTYGVATTSANGLMSSTDKIKLNELKAVKEVTQAEYDALGDIVNSNNIVYYITDAGIDGDARNVTFNNTASGLTAINVQDAIDEVKAQMQIVSSSPSLPLEGVMYVIVSE